MKAEAMSSPIRLPSPSADPGLALILLPLAALVGAALLCESSLDLLASDVFYDPVRHDFPMRKDWVYAKVLHEGGKGLMVALATTSFLGFLGSFRWRRFAPWRWPLLYTTWCIAWSSALVGILKHCTNRYCPWDMIRYGGKVPYNTLFTDTPAPFSNGHGWPAGHAAPAFALCCFYLVARARGANHPAWWLLPSLLIGGFFAWVQQVRGAHFLSHNLWSAAIAWLVATISARSLPTLGPPSSV